MHDSIQFQPRWKEELLATSKDGVLVFELTMGKLQVYFPDRDMWLARVPAWAKDQWEVYHNACERWCAQQGIPFTVVSNGFVYELKG
ncbi:MAG: hypothetical protein KF880_11440 [Ferruginibacter sp.]|nr:hypothetical protein [Ferruginibacter sp.]